MNCNNIGYFSHLPLGMEYSLICEDPGDELSLSKMIYFFKVKHSKQAPL